MLTLSVKPLLGLAIFGTLLLAVSAGCKKSSGNSSSSKGVSASVAGAGFQSQADMGQYSISKQLIQLLGYKVTAGDTLAMLIAIKDTIKVNQHATFNSGTGIEYFDTNGTFDYLGYPGVGYGNVMITAWDTTKHTMAGTFSGVLEGYYSADTVVIANGHFNTTYQVVP